MLTFLYIFLWIIVGLLLVALLYVLLVPFRLRIDSREGYVNLYWGPAASGGLYWQNEKLEETEVRFKVFFFGKKFNVLEILAKSKKDDAEKKKKRSKNKLSAIKKGNFRSGLAILKSFKVIHFELMIDTGDYCLNGMLVPINYINPLEKFPVTINFIGKNYLVCDIKNSGIRVLRSFIKHKIQ
ncbi:MAG: hypothetical protein HKN92_09865 [Chitinophagales bacterium]|nr:hypothetical protein [Chitinophagales bacterium]